MSFVGPALWFLAHYLLTMLVCGGVVWHLVSRHWTDRPQSSDDRRRLQVATFLIGTALAPFLIGLVQGALWFTIRGQPLWVYAALQWIWVVALLAMVRPWVRDCRIELLRAVRATRTSSLASCGLLIVLGFVGIQAAYHALGPQRHYDASTYALDARRLAEERSWSALMGHEATDETNQFANHNHGSSYQSFLSASLLYRNPRQDFALRMAQRVLAVHVFIVLIGLGLRLGWAVGLLAPLALLTYTYFGTMLSTASRDFYRILPLMFIFGMFRLGGAWPAFNAQGLLIALGFTFLWNSHASSLLIAPTLLACMLVLAPRASSIAALVAGFLISVPLGGLRLLQSFMRTGDPLHDSPLHNLNYLDTAIIAPWFAARGTLPAGPAHALGKFAEQFNNDGKIAVIGLWASVLALVAWLVVRIRTKRTPGDPMLLLAGGFILVCLLLLSGVLDGVSERLSATLAMNPRYRAHWYPLAALMAGYFIWSIAEAWWKRLPARTMNLVIVVLVAASVIPAAGAWKGQSVGQFADTRKANAHMAARDRWPGLLGCLDPRELVLMDYAYLGWYQTDNRIMFTQDPRLREAFTAADPAQVVRFLDSLGVRSIYLINLEQRAIFESGVALGKALHSPAYDLVFESPGNWYLYRRVLEKSPDPAPPPVVVETQPTALAWDLCESLIPVLQDRSLSERAKAVESILRLGRQAGPAAARLMTMPINDRARQSLREIVASAESNELSTIQLLDFLEGETNLQWRRPDARPLEKWRGPDFANHLRDLALMRGVSLARPAREFLGLLSDRSCTGHERFVAVEKDGTEHELLEWITRSAIDATSPPAIQHTRREDSTGGCNACRGGPHGSMVFQLGSIISQRWRRVACSSLWMGMRCNAWSRKAVTMPHGSMVIQLGSIVSQRWRRVACSSLWMSMRCNAWSRKAVTMPHGSMVIQLGSIVSQRWCRVACSSLWMSMRCYAWSRKAVTMPHGSMMIQLGSIVSQRRCRVACSSLWMSMRCNAWSRKAVTMPHGSMMIQLGSIVSQRWCRVACSSLWMSMRCNAWSRKAVTMPHGSMMIQLGSIVSQRWRRVACSSLWMGMRCNAWSRKAVTMPHGSMVIQLGSIVSQRWRRVACSSLWMSMRCNACRVRGVTQP